MRKGLRRLKSRHWGVVFVRGSVQPIVDNCELYKMLWKRPIVHCMGGRDSCFPEFILKRYDKLFIHRRRTYPAKNKFEVIIIS